MKGREGKGPPSADLLVCFPSRAHLTLMPKPICSPARALAPNRHHHHHHHSHKHHHHKKPMKRAFSAGQASPLAWAKTKPTSEIAEPTSPKVTCAGQIKVRAHKPDSCKNWQSVMEEIERLHNRKQKKKHKWVETLGFKKEVMQFLTCLRSIKLDFRCFGSFPSSGITSDDDEEEEDDDFKRNYATKEAENEENETSRTVFSKWFMVLQENQNRDLVKRQNKHTDASCKINNEEGDDQAPCAPPSNALLLMRCRSAPAKSWLEEKEEDDEEEEEEEEEEDEENDEEEKKAQLMLEEEKKIKKESLIMMRYNTDFSRFSTDIAKENWVVGGTKDPLSRSRSWKR